MSHAHRLAAAGGDSPWPIALAACGADEASTQGSETTAVRSHPSSRHKTSTKQHNDADVTFAQTMIPHHAQALSMADLTPQKAESAEVRAVAEKVQAAQVPEIETMTTWLTNWGAEVPATSRDHGAEHGGAWICPLTCPDDDRRGDDPTRGSLRRRVRTNVPGDDDPTP